jgi:magnesium-transporting ATPase (P-type)
MIGIITIVVVLIVLGIMSIIQTNKRIKRIKELEERLTQYYKEREIRLKSKGVIKRGHEWPCE